MMQREMETYDMQENPGVTTASSASDTSIETPTELPTELPTAVPAIVPEGVPEDMPEEVHVHRRYRHPVFVMQRPWIWRHTGYLSDGEFDELESRLRRRVAQRARLPPRDRSPTREAVRTRHRAEAEADPRVVDHQAQRSRGGERRRPGPAGVVPMPLQAQTIGPLQRNESPNPAYMTDRRVLGDNSNDRGSNIDASSAHRRRRLQGRRRPIGEASPAGQPPLRPSIRQPASRDAPSDIDRRLGEIQEEETNKHVHWEH